MFTAVLFTSKFFINFTSVNLVGHVNTCVRLIKMTQERHFQNIYCLTMFSLKRLNTKLIKLSFPEILITIGFLVMNMLLNLISFLLL